MEQEQIVKSYDPVIMRRLLTFLRPHRIPTAIAILSLFLATLSELLLPVVLQRTLDNYIFVSFRRLEAGQEGSATGDLTGPADEAKEIAGSLFIPDHRLDAVHGIDKQDLIDREVLSETLFFVFPIDRDDRELSQTIERHRERIEIGDEYGAISQEALAGIPEEEAFILKSTYVSKLTDMGLIFLALLLSVLVFTFLQIYLMARTGQDVMRDIRIRLFDHVLHQSLSYLGRNPVGRMVTRLTNDVETINELFTSVVTSLLKDVALMIGVIITLFLLSPALGLVAVLTLPPVLIMTLIFRKRARDAFRKVRLWVSRVNSFLSEHISGMSVVQTFVQERRSEEEFIDQNQRLMKANLGEMYVFATFRPIVDFLSSLSLGVVIYFGAGFHLRNIVSLGILIAFLNLIRRFYQPVMDIAEKYTILQSAMAGGERVFNLLDEEERIPDTGTVPAPGAIRGEIIFDDVRFAYKEDEPVLKGLSFRVRPGETVAIVGYTGAGKTTITNLLTRLWDVRSGRILIDGTDIRDYPLADLRGMVQPVAQDVFIFSGTIEENIRLGTGIPEIVVHEAARMVQADRFIRPLPEGYATMMREGGTNISSGQRQLLAFARVIAHDPAIVIMDEATGSIDTETEKLIQKGIDTMIHGRTAIVIAHRLSTIRHADRILVLAEGTLVEEGSHEELLAKQGVYFNLYKLQYEPGAVAE